MVAADVPEAPPRVWPRRGWGIVNAITKRLYIPGTLWVTKAEADEELAALLAPYSPDSLWRRRLTVKHLTITHRKEKSR